ncbi:SDR family oxidoreductase [Limoniibacter endophyticus]|uniref:3-oxoacyl-ACP reductase n=1 Tax=Limoniibacter endophyticus TaxID=1565040 RepID=A0A8J3GEZ8_9HYPH|nr:SDR family oxidoreductase [Limoniibacter endophyticus]GHC63740.1 3-oxoacyl-ACP reductase [Limoniibacter endophyticus]
MDFGIKGKKALVLGASRGLGRAIANALHAEGVEVIGAARNIGEIQTIFSKAVSVDLSDKASVAALIEEVKTLDIDILVNNSGGPKAGPALGQDTEAWASAFETMALSLFAITEAALPRMLERRWGRIITVASSGVVQPIPGLALSNGVRAAIAGWSKTLATEVAASGITVNMILPGRIATDRLRELNQGRAERVNETLETIEKNSAAQIPAGRFGKPEEFGAVAAFLASQQASYLTGSAIRVDGGLVSGH